MSSNQRKHIYSTLILFLFGIMAVGSIDSGTESGSGQSTSSARSEWHSGGSLHTATVREWKNASDGNKLATCADWLAATQWKNNLNSASDFDRLKPKARRLVREVDTAVSDELTNDLKVTEIAAAIIVLDDSFGP